MRFRPRHVPISVACLERTCRGEEPTVEGQEIGLLKGPFVGHRHAQEHLPLAVGVADRPTSVGLLGATGGTGDLGAFVEQRDDPPVERVDPPA